MPSPANREPALASPDDRGALTKPIIVYGASTFGYVVRALVADCGRTFAGFVDDWTTGPEVLGTLDDIGAHLKCDGFELAIAIGYKHLDARLGLFERLKSAGYGFATLVHPTAYVANTARIGSGAIVMARAIVDTKAIVQELAVLWPGSNVSHDAVVGRNTFVSPGSTICGHACIGSSCFVGAGAVVTDHVAVPDHSFVKAGACCTGAPLRRWAPEK